MPTRNRQGTCDRRQFLNQYIRVPDANLPIDPLLSVWPTVRRASGTKHFVNFKMPTNFELTDAAVNMTNTTNDAATDGYQTQATIHTFESRVVILVSLCIACIRMVFSRPFECHFRFLSVPSFVLSLVKSTPVLLSTQGYVHVRNIRSVGSLPCSQHFSHLYIYSLLFILYD
jgi:uncharacterized membrane protein